PTHGPFVKAMLAVSGFTVHITDHDLCLRSAAPPPNLSGPVFVSDDTWQIWASSAARTYVPGSTVSRTAGAGAGLSDND
ncbi:MAG: hypothetical protein AAFQ09_07440, partial [Pseudomonadota bacterium]